MAGCKQRSVSFAHTHTCTHHSLDRAHDRHTYIPVHTDTYIHTKYVQYPPRRERRGFVVGLWVVWRPRSLLAEQSIGCTGVDWKAKRGSPTARPVRLSARSNTSSFFRSFFLLLVEFVCLYIRRYAWVRVVMRCAAWRVHRLVSIKTTSANQARHHHAEARQAIVVLHCIAGKKPLGARSVG